MIYREFSIEQAGGDDVKSSVKSNGKGGFREGLVFIRHAQKGEGMRTMGRALSRNFTGGSKRWDRSNIDRFRREGQNFGGICL